MYQGPTKIYINAFSVDGPFQNQLLCRTCLKALFSYVRLETSGENVGGVVFFLSVNCFLFLIACYVIKQL